MLVIRLQRTGRKGHAMFRVVVQDSRRTPSSGKVVAWLGHYDPHAKDFKVDKEKTAFYLEHGAQPSPRLASLLKEDGVKLPDWVVLKTAKSKTVRNPDKRRSTAPAEEVKEEAPAAEEKVEEVAETPVEAPIEEVKAEAPSEATEEAVAETPEEAPEAPAEEAKNEEPEEPKA